MPKKSWHMQKCLEIIDKWTAKWRVTLAPEKTKLIIFSRCPTHRRIQVNLTLRGTKIKEVDQARLLGVLYDNRLTWHKYKEELINRVSHKTWTLKKLSAKSRWRKPEVIIKLYEAIVVPVWTYGSFLFTATNEEFWKKFRSNHGDAIKSFANLPKCSSYENACDSLNQTEMDKRLKEIGKKRIKNLLRTTPFYDELYRKQQTMTETTAFYSSPIRAALTREEVEEIGRERKSAGEPDHTHINSND